MIEVATSKKLLERVGLEEPSSLMHTTQFADNTIIFSIASKHQLSMIKLLLYFFELLTRASKSISVRLSLWTWD